MGVMCSAITGDRFVTFDLGIAPNGNTIYRISVWNGEKWSYAKYRSFEAARKTFKLLSRNV